ncbi:MAG: hypothetical protein FWG58_01915 [Methanomassiliicoccaceae archaeon]|nr:hypothetical protein [Methanomassiliicoccaceae archaeon]
MAISDILIRGIYRIDLFCKVVCGKFALSERMKERASLESTINKARLFICSLNDIFLFKCMTERDGDLIDCFRMATEYELNWGAVLDEAVEQSVRGRGTWITWVTDRMEELDERGVNIPVLNKMIALSDELMNRRAKETEERDPDI